jgi:hypothetical protein
MFMGPQLPEANYKVWVRGYGLVDSKPVDAAPGTTLALTAVIARSAQAAAQYYPGDYWYSSKVRYRPIWPRHKRWILPARFLVSL